MKVIIAAVLGVFIVLIGTQVKVFSDRKAEALKNFASLNEKLRKAQADQAQLKNEIDYFSNPDNLEKELRSRFNFRVPGEKLIIIVPPNGSSTSP